MNIYNTDELIKILNVQLHSETCIIKNNKNEKLIRKLIKLDDLNSDEINIILNELKIFKNIDDENIIKITDYIYIEEKKELYIYIDSYNLKCLGDIIKERKTGIHNINEKVFIL